MGKIPKYTDSERLDLILLVQTTWKDCQEDVKRYQVQKNVN